MCDRRLQPDAILEDHLRRERFLIEYETGSASVRNEHHKSATLTKMNRYVHFFAMYTGNDFKTTLYGRHFQDDLAPILLFLTRTKARRDTIRDVAEERNRHDPRKYDIRALMLDEAAAHFRSLFFQETGTSTQSAPRTLSRGHDSVVVPRDEIDLLSRVLEESLLTIQTLRHTIRAGNPVVAEPRYPDRAQAAIDALKRLNQS